MHRLALPGAMSGGPGEKLLIGFLCHRGLLRVRFIGLFIFRFKGANGKNFQFFIKNWKLLIMKLEKCPLRTVPNFKLWKSGEFHSEDGFLIIIEFWSKVVKYIFFLVLGVNREFY